MYPLNFNFKKETFHTMGYSSLLGQDNGDVCAEFKRNDKSFK